MAYERPTYTSNSYPQHNPYNTTQTVTGRYSVSGVISRSSISFGAVILAAVAGWGIFSSHTTQELWLPLLLVSIFGALGVAIWEAIAKQGSPVRTILYSALQGLGLGLLSAGFENILPGIVLQAVLAVIAVFLTVLLLFRSGAVRVTARANKIFLIALFGYAIFGIFNLILLLTGLTNNPFGLYGATIHGIPIGLGLSIIGIFLGAYRLVKNFDETEKRAQQGDTEDKEWKTAFNFVATMVWLYLEILRLLALARR